MKLLIAGAAALALSSAASAADASSRFFIMGAPGSMTCSDFSAKKDTGTVGGDLGLWLSGYVTAFNRVTPETYHAIGETPLDQVYGALVAYCGEYPTELVENGVFTVLQALYKTRQQTAP